MEQRFGAARRRRRRPRHRVLPTGAVSGVARRRGALVDVHLAVLADKAGVALAAERVEAVHARAVVGALDASAVVDVRLAVAALEACRAALALVTTQI